MREYIYRGAAPRQIRLTLDEVEGAIRHTYRLGGEFILTHHADGSFRMTQELGAGDWVPTGDEDESRR